MNLKNSGSNWVHGFDHLADDHLLLYGDIELVAEPVIAVEVRPLIV